MAGGFAGGGKSKSRTIDIQLTTLVDVFVVLVIFMVKATVIGASDLSFPDKMKPPRSFSKETIESAPNLVLTPTEVRLSAVGKLPLAPVPIGEFKQGRDVTTPKVAELKTTLAAYIAALPPAMKVQGTTLNIIADRETAYSNIFDVIRVVREAGFETMLFVATGDSLPPALQAMAGQQGVALPSNGRTQPPAAAQPQAPTQQPAAPQQTAPAPKGGG